jgi:ketosteroid isomerase-like protein
VDKKRSIVASTILLSLIVAGYISGGTPAAGESSVENEITQLEARRFHAMTQSDLAALDTLLADDLTYVHTSAKLDTKASFLESLRSGELKYESIDSEDVKVRVVGDAAVVTGRGKMKIELKDRELNFQIRFTDVYAKRGGRWQMVAWQSTRIPEQ